jgi:pyruvate,water dikinase
MTDLIRVGDGRLTEPAEVGHKFARQELLRHAGFAVPEFFCVSVAGFDAAAADLFATAPGVDADAELSDWARGASATLAGRPLPAAVAADLRAAATALAGDGGLVAVRACVVADEHGVGEDGADDAFAGLTESFLYVPADDVPRRVAQCWASGLRQESIRYRARRGLAPATTSRSAATRAAAPTG